MADSIREKILQNVETTLKTITVANGYYKDIGHVDRGRKSPDQIQLYPAAYVVAGRDSSEPLISEIHDRSLELNLFLWIKTEKGIPEEMEAFIAAAQKAMLIDHTRGGQAIDTQERDTTPLFISEDWTEAVTLLEYNVRYRTKRTDPYALG